MPVSYQPKVYRKHGGDEQVVASGGTYTIESGGTLAIASGATWTLGGTTITATAADLNAISTMEDFTADTGDVAANDIAYASGYDAGNTRVKLAKAKADAAGTCEDLYWCPDAVTAGDAGTAKRHGYFTSSLNGTAGDKVYLSDATAGGVTLVEPTGTDIVRIIGSLLTTGASGVVSVDLGGEAIAVHDHADNAGGGTLSTPALTGTTATTFDVDSGGDHVRLDSTGQTADHAFTFPNADDELCGIAAGQTLTNKTLTTPTIGDFSNSAHDHSNAAGGGTITATGLTGTTNNTYTFDSDNTTGKIRMAVTTGGTNHTLTLTNTVATGDQTITFPDATTTLVGTDTTDTLSSKTLSNPHLSGGALTLDAAVSVSGTWTDLGAVTTVDINGGTIDGVTIGGAAAPTVVDLGSVATCDINGGTIDGATIGGTTPDAVTATNLVADSGGIDAGKDGTAGTVDIFPTTASNSKMIISCTDIGAAARNLTITNAAQGQATTITIPDPGGAAANFVLSEGAATVNGVKTFGSAPVLPAINAADSALDLAGKAGSGGVGGQIILTGGLGDTNFAGGTVDHIGGAGQGTGAGGAVTVRAGASGGGVTGNGGAATFIAGAAVSSNGSGGDTALTGGLASGTGTGGDITLASGASAGGTGTAGAIAIDAGAPTGGTEGAITIGSANCASVGIGRATKTTTILGTCRADDLNLGATAGGAGVLELFPTGGSLGKIQISPQDNAADHTIDIQNASFGQPVTLTIPDPSNATSSFVLNKGTNMISSTDTHTGTLDISGATVTYRAIINADIAAGAAIVRSKLAQDALKPYAVDLTSLRVWDDLNAILPNAGATDDLGIVHNTWATGSSSLVTEDLKAAGATPNYAYGEFVLPAEYDAGQTITLRFRAHAKTTVADNSMDLDVVVYKSNNEASIGADLCTQAAQSMNNTSWSNYDFTINPIGLNPGDRLVYRVHTATNDAGTGTAVIAEIGDIRFLLDIKG